MMPVEFTRNTRVLQGFAELSQESCEQEHYQGEEYGAREEQHC